VYIERSLLDMVRDDGPAWKLEDSRFIEEAVKDPDAIFEGLNRPGMKNGAAYSVRPEVDPEEEPEAGTLRYGFAFVVFARPGTWSYVILDWEWRAADGNEPGHPEGWANDYARRTWTKGQNLSEYLAGNPPRGFRPGPHYFPTGDYVTLFIKDERGHAERVDDLLTVYLSLATGELVGCKIKGVKRLLAELGAFGLTVDLKDVPLALFFVLGKATAKDPAQRRRYEEAASLVQDVAIGRGELLGT